MHFGNRKHAVVESGERVKTSLKDLIEGTEDLLRSTAAYSGSEVEAVRNRLKHQLESARRQFHQGERAAKRRYRQISHTTGDYVQSHPWTISGVAVAVGVLIGACLLAGQQGRRR